MGTELQKRQEEVAKRPAEEVKEIVKVGVLQLGIPAALQNIKEYAIQQGEGFGSIPGASQGLNIQRNAKAPETISNQLFVHLKDGIKGITGEEEKKMATIPKKTELV